MKKDTTKSAEQIVFEKVKSALYKRRLAPGTALTEQSLCDALGVGRTPVRSALKRLAQDGYVEIVPNKGAYVTHGGPEQISQLYDVRIPLELLAVKVTMDSYTDEDFQFLTSCIEKKNWPLRGKIWKLTSRPSRIFICTSSEKVKILIWNRHIKSCSRKFWSIWHYTTAFIWVQRKNFILSRLTPGL